MNNLLSLIGSTPLVEIRNISTNPKVKILAKLEMKNPGGSVKDRVALAMIERAENTGDLVPGKTVIEATSGNTGIGLAMVCAVKGYPIKLLMSSAASEERKKIMRAYGAEIVLTPGHLSTDGAIEEAYRMAREEPDRYVLMDQFNNPASIEAHYRTTGPEIWEQTRGEVTHVAACLGTTGTIMGITRKMREIDPEIRCIGIEPYPGHKIQGLKNMQESYPPGIYDKKFLDQVIHVKDQDAFAMCRELAEKEGLFVGMSSGAAMAGSLELAKMIDQGTIVTIFPDSGERYLSTALFSSPDQGGIKIFDLRSRTKVSMQSTAKKPVLFTIGPRTDFPDDPDFWRRAVLLDVVHRFLVKKGDQSKPAVAVADFDDRTLEAVRKKGMSLKEFSSRSIDLLENLAAELNLSKEFRFVPASANLEKGVQICSRLLSKGLAYEKLRSVYFDVGRDAEYGHLSGIDPESIISGKTVDLEDYVKDSPRDFTLLKRASLKDLKEDNVLKTRWGNVRPSWYLQMAASARESHLDLVLGGEAHFFPHLDNLKSLWQGAMNLIPQCWMLAQAVRPEPGTSLLPGLNDLFSQGTGYLALRLWLLSASYHKSLIFSEPSLNMWMKNWHKVQDLYAILKSGRFDQDGESRETIIKKCTELRQSLDRHLEDDLSIYRFWPDLLSFCKEIRKVSQALQLSQAEADACLEALKDIDDILGILDWNNLPLAENEFPAGLSQLIQERITARNNRDYVLADQLRQKLTELGFRLEDTHTGPRVYKVR
ncbi:cysteine synthase [Desulfonatronovibrio hydrogenovorans]|uniref:cysteine synthase n=1 Tax=Desulfonatronovibrio hydrogenovorans TaxID=53245 RepID=UPI00048E4587|nr:cysteine synthase [Desulfonatronovibrio hydrogenovorans]